MNKNSIFFGITIAFLISLVSISVLFFTLLKMDHNLIVEELFDRYYMTVRVTTHAINNSESQSEINKQIANLKMELVDGNRQSILKNSKIILKKKLLQGYLKILKHQSTHYLDFANSNGHFLLKDLLPRNKKKTYFWLIYFIASFILVVTYVFVIRRLYPLKSLERVIQRYGEGDLDIDCSTHKKDEISRLANEFDRAIKKIKTLTDKRTVFLRNIMHELKTPITKGKLAVELIEPSQHKDLLRKVLTRIDTLANEFASIDKSTSQKDDLNIRPYRFQDIIDHVMDILYISREDIRLDIDDRDVLVDFELFVLAVKNLVDNGLKYAKDGQILITKENGSLQFINPGESLERPFEEYLKPFVKGGKDNRNNGSMGLGLYLVHYITDVHRFSFDYTYQNGQNIFTIRLNNR